MIQLVFQFLDIVSYHLVADAVVLSRIKHEVNFCVELILLLVWTHMSSSAQLWKALLLVLIFGRQF